MGPIHNFEDLFDLLKRRFWLIAILFVVGSVSAVMFALSIPHRYASSEVIQIERPRIAGELAPSTVMGSSARRLQLIEQKLMSRGGILEMVEDLGLYQDVVMSDTDKMIAFRAAVSIDGTAAVREGPTDDGTVAALTFTAEFGTPEHAQAVAHELARRTIELSAAARAEQTRATLDFFLQEEAALRAAIAELEDEIAQFRSENDIATTGRIESQQSEITTVNAAILTVERSRIAVEQELAQIDPNVQRSATRRRFEELQRQLEVLAEQRAFLEQQKAALRRSIQSSPEAESRVSLFESQLEQYQSQLHEVSNRRRQAEIGHRIEVNRQAETMRILEPAPLPDYPVQSKRRKIAGAGAFGSLFLGFALAFLLDMLRPVVRSSAQLKREFGIMPAAVIPVMRPRRSGPVGWLLSLVDTVMLRLRGMGSRA